MFGVAVAVGGNIRHDAYVEIRLILYHGIKLLRSISRFFHKTVVKEGYLGSLYGLHSHGIHNKTVQLSGIGSFTGGDGFTDAVPTGTYRYRIEVLREGKLLATSNETAVAVKEIGEVRFTDVNADGKIDLHDALLTLRKALSDEDGAQLADVLLILRHVGGSIDLFTF